MDIACRVGDIADDLCFLLRQLPALALGAVHTVVSAATAHQELSLPLVGNVWFKGTSGHVLKVVGRAVRLLSAVCIHTLVGE